MFTVQQIKDAHAKVKSGADFPRYIQELKHLGLTRYEFLLSTGDTVYYGENGFSVQSGARYETRAIKYPASASELRGYIAAHQRGESDFHTICVQAAAAGVEKWVIDFEKMTCTYYDLDKNEMVVEPIPEGEYQHAD